MKKLFEDIEQQFQDQLDIALQTKTEPNDEAYGKISSIINSLEEQIKQNDSNQNHDNDYKLNFDDQQINLLKCMFKSKMAQIDAKYEVIDEKVKNEILIAATLIDQQVDFQEKAELAPKMKQIAHKFIKFEGKQIPLPNDFKLFECSHLNQVNAQQCFLCQNAKGDRIHIDE